MQPAPLRRAVARISGPVAVLALALSGGGALAQQSAGGGSSVNAARCQNLQAEAQQRLQQRVMGVVPKESPSSAVARSADVGGILRTTVSSPLDSLLSMDFAGLFNNLVNQGLVQAQRKANDQFNRGINDALAKVGGSRMGVSLPMDSLGAVSTPGFAGPGAAVRPPTTVAR